MEKKKEDFELEYEFDKESKKMLSNMNKFGELVQGIIKSSGLKPLEALISCASMSETIGELYLKELMNKENLDDTDKIQIGRLSKILENCKILSIQRSMECYITQKLGIIPKEIIFGEDNLISKPLKKRFSILKKAGFRCRYCGRSPPEVQLELEHIIPKCKGGTNNEDNLTVSCRECNKGKSGDLL